RDIARPGLGQQILAGPVEQGVAPGKKAAVEVGLVHRLVYRLRLVDPEAEALDEARVAQFDKRPEAAAGEILPRPVVPLAVGDAADVVHEEEIDAGQAEALLTIVEAAHQTVIAVVEDLAETETVVPAGIERVLRRLRR